MSPVSPGSNRASSGPGAADRPAGFARRAGAACLDLAGGFVFAVALSSSVGMCFARRAVVTLAIGQPGTWWQGPLPMVLGAFGELVYLLPTAWLLVWSLDPLTGATLGKRAFGLRVRDVNGGSASPARRWGRWAIETVGFSGWTVALVAGRWELAVAASLAGVVVLAGCLAALGPSARTLHDRLSLTDVVRLRPPRGHARPPG